MNKEQLADAVREEAAMLMDWADCGECVRDGQANDAHELLRTLARIVEGKNIAEAFGAPGDWGYGTRIGKALAATASE